MLVWSANFPLAQGSTLDGLLDVSKTWLTGSPHSTWRDHHLDGDASGKILSLEHEGESVQIARFKAEQADTGWCGFRYARPERGERGLQSQWTTEIVGHLADEVLLVSVRLQCDAVAMGQKLPRPKKPYIVRLLLERLGGGMDASLRISDRPALLRDSSEEDLDLATRVVRGTLGNRLPVIYVSASFQNQPAVEPGALAEMVAGTAHVVVEPSRDFSRKLAPRTSWNNPYGGAVAVHWPSDAGVQTRLVPNRFLGAHQYPLLLVSAVLKASNSLRPPPLCSWTHIEDLASRGRVEALRRQGSQAVEEYTKAFDGEIAAKEEKIRQGEEEIGRLKQEIQRLEGVLRSPEARVLTPGNERAFYRGEIRDAVHRALEHARAHFLPDGRMLHILEDLLAANPLSEEGQALEDAFRCLATSSEFGRRERQALERVGFEITEDGKHFKATLGGDDRYVFTIPKSPSDWRSMKNNASDLRKKLLK